jgi:hypothetical protein
LGLFIFKDQTVPLAIINFQNWSHEFIFILFKPTHALFLKHIHIHI